MFCTGWTGTSDAQSSSSHSLRGRVLKIASIAPRSSIYLITAFAYLALCEARVSGSIAASARATEGALIGWPMVCIHRPSPHSNSVAPASFGNPNLSAGDGLSARCQISAVGISAPCNRLVATGPPLPVRRRA